MSPIGDLQSEQLFYWCVLPMGNPELLDRRSLLQLTAFINAIPRRQNSSSEIKNPQKQPFQDVLNGKCSTEFCAKVLELIKSVESSTKCSTQYFLEMDGHLPENKHVYQKNIDTEAGEDDDVDQRKLVKTPHLDALFTLLGGFLSSYGRTTMSENHLMLPFNNCDLFPIGCT